MLSPITSRLHRAAFVSFVAWTVFGLVAVPTLATLQPVEQILYVGRVGHPSAGLGMVTSRLTFPSGARWDMDSENGPLTLTVSSGKIGVVLGGGLARIKRQENPLQQVRIHRLEPAQMAYLWPGDTLTIVRGYGLRVDNDDFFTAVARVSRLLREPLPAPDSSELSVRWRSGQLR
jgi:hypothetical protein